MGAAPIDTARKAVAFARASVTTWIARYEHTTVVTPGNRRAKAAYHAA